MFPVQKYADILKPLAENKGINVHFSHLIQSVDKATRTVKFKNADGDIVETEFDLLHIVPPQTANESVRHSALAAETGLIDVNPATLQHNQFPNVFALGDNANIPAAKTAAGVFS